MADVGQMDLSGVKPEKEVSSEALNKDNAASSAADGVLSAVRLNAGEPGSARKRNKSGEESSEEEDESDDQDSVPKGEKKAGRRKINIEFIEDKSRRHITFSKRKAGIMKKAYELSTLTGTQVLLLVASETGHVYTFATPKLQPLITKTEGKNLIQACLNSPDNSTLLPVNRLYDNPSDQMPPSAQTVQQVLSGHHEPMHMTSAAYQVGGGPPSLQYPPQQFSYPNMMGIPPNYMGSVPPTYGTPSMSPYNASYMPPSHHGSVQPKK